MAIARRALKIGTWCVGATLGLGILIVLALVLWPVLQQYLYGPIHAPWGRWELGTVVDDTPPHRTALAIACSEGTLTSGMISEDLGLDISERYPTKYTKSVAVHVDGVDRFTITAILKDIRVGGLLNRKLLVTEGTRVAWQGSCGEDDVSWTVCSGLPAQLLKHTRVSSSTPICPNQ